MAVSRRLALLSLGTILLCLLFARAAIAESDYGDDIHAVRHSSASDNCNREQPYKGDQCREENDGVEDEDFDDTYKIVNNVAIRLSASGSKLREAEEEDDLPVPEEEIRNLSIVGH